MEKYFNLVDEPWIPVVDVGNVSLRQLFSQPEYRALGGTPVQKIALMKLLLAIAQAAATPDDDDAWQQIGWQGMSERCLNYLTQWHDRFWLYGDLPFLQMPAICWAEIKPYGAVLPEVSTGNTTVLSQWQMEKSLSDAQKALLIVTLMSFALGGKKTDNSVVLSEGYYGKSNEKGKPKTGSPGPSVAHMGLLHSFCLGEHLLQSLWLNLLTQVDVAGMTMFSGGLGTPPWERMPEGEDCAVAGKLKQTLMGRLIPVARFCLLTDAGLHYSEGVSHLGYKEGMWDPTVAVNTGGKEFKAIWVETDRRPWRQLTSLLSFIGHDKGGAECYQLRLAVPRARHHTPTFAIWSGGMRVSSNAGEQYVSGSDDMVESEIWLISSQMGADWFAELKRQVSNLESMAKSLYGACSGYFKSQNMDGSNFAAQTTGLFWQLCEHNFSALVVACGSRDPTQTLPLRRCFIDYAQQAYNQYCPNETARQIDAWAKHRPCLNKYLQQEVQ
ncbi:type I-E CRISPR-associated protein Cse1/CasA [Limnobaculum xujianqingii]|uniref:type I-E CRISPR-associated protein Cse1/CasA n=1 Tax=Limnobaculum xujianqingii TaxID=2738837 RepID=UPI001126D8DD|nr:type I-E CRISPR-associated protein Cse1/CasA [Limnobaculum xujianqingii]